MEAAKQELEPGKLLVDAGQFKQFLLPSLGAYVLAGQFWQAVVPSENLPLGQAIQRVAKSAVPVISIF